MYTQLDFLDVLIYLLEKLHVSDEFIAMFISRHK